LALLAQLLRAEQAEQWGGIWGCVEDGQLLADATALVEQLATSATRALAVVKEELQVSLDNDFNTQQELEVD
jgi:2-(1,2-epoxy-1,2-dihydrophenyl)acetyl-CoA isomerase